MTRITTSLVLVTAIAVVPLAALAAPITVPSDLNVGDQYRLAFVTSTTLNAVVTGTDITLYNAFVSGVANGQPELAALGTTWTAIGSTSADDARDNTSTNPFTDGAGVPIYRLDDNRIADDNSDLWDGTIQTALSITESGVDIANIAVWTGTATDGTGAVGLGSMPNVTFGVAGFVAAGWIDQGAVGGGGLPIYGISDVLEVIPEPSTLGLAAFGFLGLAAYIGRRKFR